MKVHLKHGKVTQNMHGASRNNRYVWDVSVGHAHRPSGRLGPPLVPPFGPIFTPAEETLVPEPFSLEAIPISAAIAFKFRGDLIPVSAPCRDGEVPPDSIDVASLLHEVGVVPPRA